MTDVEAARQHIRRAYIRATNPGVRACLDDALQELDAEHAPGLAECEVCGRVGLAEQLDAHDC